MANRGTSIDGGWKLVSFGLCVFSGSFGVRSIVLCKCSGKYIDIYFILKITCLESSVLQCFLIIYLFFVLFCFTLNS